jgi:hypothetical protein
MAKDKVQERKDKDQKPKVLYTIQAKIWEDGIWSGKLISGELYGRERVKAIYTSGDDFLAAVRSVVPSAIDKIEGLVKAIDRDAGTTEKMENSVVGQVKVDIFSNGVIDVDFAEMVQGPIGRPKAWRMTPDQFLPSMRSVTGSAVEPLKSLPSGGVITAKGKDEDEDEG